MTFGSLFAGIGGMDLGLERAGMECRWQVEIDPFCRKVLAKHWPKVPKYGDITTINYGDLEPVDVIAGGFPCQDLSVSGKRQGIREGTRSGLWANFAQIIGAVRPRFVLIENVAGLLDNEPMRRVLGDLSALGFDAEWNCFPAFLFGVPIRRDRVFIVAYPSGYRLEGEGQLEEAGGSLERQIFRAPSATADEIRRRVPRPCCARSLGVAYGISLGVDNPKQDWKPRVKSCGNAVVPQVAEWIGRRIIEAAA